MSDRKMYMPCYYLFLSVGLPIGGPLPRKPYKSIGKMAMACRKPYFLQGIGVPTDGMALYVCFLRRTIWSFLISFEHCVVNCRFESFEVDHGLNFGISCRTVVSRARAWEHAEN